MEANKDIFVKVWAFEMRYPAAGQLCFGNDITISCTGTSCTVESKTPKRISELKKYADKVENMENERIERRKRCEKNTRKYLESIEE